jgi:Tol biopolymer transport system component
MVSSLQILCALRTDVRYTHDNSRPKHLGKSSCLCFLAGGRKSYAKKQSAGGSYPRCNDRFGSSGLGAPEQIKITGIPELNNDHVLANDHESIFLSVNQDWHVYQVAIASGVAERITANRPNKMQFLHRVNSRSTEIEYVELDGKAEDIFSSGRIHIQNIQTGEDRSLVHGSGSEDDCQFSDDDNWVYFNSEHFSTALGAAQIVRAKVDGTEFEQLTFDNRVNWFPHTSSDGKLWVYLSYPPETVGHPADLDVEIKLVREGAWQIAESTQTIRWSGNNHRQ